MAMHIVHLLRKCDPAEWGGTETAIQRLFEGLRDHGVVSIVHCPRLGREQTNGRSLRNPLVDAGCRVRRYRAFVPILGLSRQKRRQHVAVGGNLMSFDLIRSLWKEPQASLIHTHTLGRLGGIASIIARGRHLPLVVTIHGGLLDLPEQVKREMRDTSSDGFDWGRPFGYLFQSRRLLERADAVLTCNPREAELLQQQHPDKRVQVQPHGVPMAIYEEDRRAAALAAFPQIANRSILLCVGRIDPVKNQGWLVNELPEILSRHPDTGLVLVGACTNESYGRSIQEQIQKLGLSDRVCVLGGFAPADPRLVGLFQLARAVVLPSVSETFGLVILEAWAAGTTVIASRTSGASALIQHGENGWLFDLNTPAGFHEAVTHILRDPGARNRSAQRGHRMVSERFDVTAVAGRIKELYEHLIETKRSLCHSSGR